MANIIFTTAANEKFKDLAETCVRSIKDLGYEVMPYDLGNLGFGKPFEGRFSDRIGAKIPSKPEIIQDATSRVNDNDIVVWVDADTILWNQIDMIQDQYDIGVTVRKSKTKEHELPINAGVVFVRKTTRSIHFLRLWTENCKNSDSDQVELNRICEVTSKDIGTDVNRFNTQIRVLPCDIYNNFYFRKDQSHAKIIHYKTKFRKWWPNRNVKK